MAITMAIVAIPGHAPTVHLLRARMARLRRPVIPRPMDPSVALHMSAAPLAPTVVAVGGAPIANLQCTDLEDPRCVTPPGVSLLSNLSLSTVPLSHLGFTTDNSFRSAVLNILKQGC